MTHDWAAPGAYFILHQSINCIRVITERRYNSISAHCSGMCPGRGMSMCSTVVEPGPGIQLDKGPSGSSSHFQPEEGPSRGLLRDCEPSDGPF